MVRVGEDCIGQLDPLVDRRIAGLGLVNVVLPGQDLVLRLSLGSDLGLNPGIDRPIPENRNRIFRELKCYWPTMGEVPERAS